MDNLLAADGGELGDGLGDGLEMTGRLDFVRSEASSLSLSLYLDLGLCIVEGEWVMGIEISLRAWCFGLYNQSAEGDGLDNGG
jgi:hypothetical protein